MRHRVASLLVTLLLGLLAWGGATLFNLSGRMSAVEADSTGLYKWMERVEGKLDRVLERRAE